jgi:hypothetical protein
MIFGAIGGMNIGRGTEVLGENLPQRHFVHHKIPHDRPGLKPRTAAVGSQRLTAYAMAWPFLVPFRRLLRLAGSRWRYSTPPPHGLGDMLKNLPCKTVVLLTTIYNSMLRLGHKLEAQI